MNVSKALAIGASALVLGGEFVPIFDPTILDEIITYIDVNTDKVYTNFSSSADQTIKLLYGDKKMNVYSCYYTVTDLSSGNVLKNGRISKPTVSVIKNRCIFSLSIPFKDNLTNEGFLITIKISNGTIVGFNETFTLYPATYGFYTYSSSNPTYSHSGRFLSIVSSTVYLDEEFDFTNTVSEISNKSEGRLNLEELYFDFKSKVPFTYSGAKLTIQDTNNVFKNLPHDRFNFVTIGLAANVDGAKVSFTLSEQLYVNLENNQMSTYMSVGSTLASDIYIPIGYESVLEQEKIYLNFDEMGSNKDALSLRLNFKYRSAYVGNCYFSDICIVGGILE